MAKSARQWDDRLARRLRFRDLRYLLAVADQGSMAKAASELGVSQPAISKAIAELENTLGVRLFDRNAQGVEPTSYGEALMRRGQAIIDELRQGIDEIEFLSDPNVGRVRMGCAESVAAGFLPAVIAPFSRLYPRVQLSVSLMNLVPPDYHELHERKLDLMIGRIVRPFREDTLSAEILFQERIFIVAGGRTPWARRRKIEPRDLLDARWIRAPLETTIGVLHADAFAQFGFKLPPPTVATYSMHVMLDLVANEGFLATVPGIMLGVCNARGIKVLPIDLPIQRRPMAIVTLKNRVPSPVIQRFIEYIRAAKKNASVEPKW
jgi:DNA-binding transcriptional LysR family regulator